MASSLSICKSALLMVNADPINSFDDSTREATMCDALYETTRDTLLMKHPWSFSLFQEKLARTTNTPLFDYDYEYQLPTGHLRVLKTDNFGNEYRLLKDKLLSDYEEVELLYQKDPGEEFYPPYFVRLLEFKMAELLSLSLVQDENMARLFSQQYLLAMREARGIDSQNTPTPSIAAHELSLTYVRGDDG